LHQNPSDLEGKADLAKLLIRSGTDEKMKYINLMNAQQLFEEVLELFSDNADALYRLGHICYENKEYEKCITYFTRALEQPLSEIRSFRAASTISKAYFSIGDEEKANRFLQKAKEIDKERNFTNEMTELENIITENGIYRRSVRYPDGTYQFITVEDAESLKDETIEDGDAELDLSHAQPTFTGPEDTVRLERKEAEILCYLIERDNRFVGSLELLNVWEEDEEPELGTIKSYISKIRTKVGECLPNDKNEIIKTQRGQGYKWICEIPTKIIKNL
jgi:tetratricopeptide (TPR) repeat protein